MTPAAAAETTMVMGRLALPALQIPGIGVIPCGFVGICRPKGVSPGQAAEFSTMTPHALEAHRGLAEILTIFDHDGEQAHLPGRPQG